MKVPPRDRRNSPSWAPSPIGMAAPNLAIAYHKANSPFAFGIGIYAPFGAGMVHDDENDPYRFLGKRMSILRLVTGPTISYRVAKSLSVGASFGLGMSYMGFDTKMRAPNDLVALTGALGEATVGLEIPILSELTLPAPWFGGGLNPYEEMGGLKFFAEDNLNTSYNVGFLWEPFNWVSFGGVYQSQAKADMKGKYTFSYSDRMRRTVNWLGSSPTTIIIAAMLDLPTYCSGTRWRETCRSRSSIPPAPNLASSSSPTPASNSLRTPTGPSGRPGKAWKSTLTGTMNSCASPSSWATPAATRKLIMENDFSDTWHFSYGLELQPLDFLTIRLGYEDRPTSISESYFGPVPLGDMKLYSAGIGIAHEASRPEFSWAYGPRASAAPG